ncbi:MAG: heavy metal translocating P-type ATPase metal-binding domain-containing protein [Bacteroidia bacterium]
MANNQVEIGNCYHCGEPLNRHKLQFDSHTFCCAGCKGAYQILNDNDLCDYYAIDKNPGNNLVNEIGVDEYSFLDEPDIKKKLIDFSDGQISKTTLKLPQVHCSSCIWLLENLQSIDSGILNSRVNFSKKTIHVTFNETKTTIRKVVELLAGFGYVPELNLESANKDKKSVNNKKLYYQLGVAGFAFGNIMLMSFPEYIGISGDFTDQFQVLFRWANALLALPVLFYSASEYLQNALNAVKTKIINLDVPIVIGMLALLGRSFYEIFTGIGAGYFDSFVGFVFFLLLGKYFQAKTYNHLSFERDFKSFFPLAILKKTNKGFKPTEITKLEVADIIQVKSGQIVPCDSILLTDKARIDYSFVTGEAKPITKNMGNLVYAGGKQVGGSIDLLVEKKVEESYLTELWQNEKEHGIGNVTQIADSVGKYFTYAILAIALFTLSYWMFFDVETAFLAFTSVLIVACPCALALSIPFTQGTAMRWLAKHGFFVKKSGLLERLSQLTHLVFDKTGTLTHSKNSKVAYQGQSITAVKNEVFSLVHQSSHPLSRKIAEFLEKNDVQLENVESFTELEGKGITGQVNGKQIKMGSALFLTGQSTYQEGSHVMLEIEGELYGEFHFELAYRDGFENVFENLKSDYNLHLISGDNNRELETLKPFFNSNSHLRFNMKPHDKQDFVCEMKGKGAKVAMIGDGLNDAGALMASDIGISITDDVNNFTPASDVIAKGDILKDFPKILRFAKSTQQIIYAAFAISFAYNIIGLSFAVQGVLSPVVSAILMPLSSITVVVFTTVVTSLTAKKLQLA